MAGLEGLKMAAVPHRSMPGGSERLVRKWVQDLDQERLDAWMRGEISVGEQVKKLLDQYGRLARSAKWSLVRWVEGLSGEGIYAWIQEQRPDLRLGEKPATVARIDQDLAEVRRLLDAL